MNLLVRITLAFALFFDSAYASSQEAYPKCAELTDNLCQSLWSKKNQGKLKVSDGIIVVAQSEKSDMAVSRLEDLHALLESESRLPSDLKKKAKSIFAELRSELANERDSKDWYRLIALIIVKWTMAVSDVASARTELRDPSLKGIKQKDLSTEQKAEYKTDLYAIKDEILEAKYKQHPNWKRVERVFNQAQQDLLAEVQKLNLPESQKKALIARVETVQLRLPYSDPIKMNADESCSSTEMRAFYSSARNAFTVCAGYFNSYQSEAALYGTVTHEISHSIDPWSTARHQYRKESPMYKSLSRLGGASGPVLPCSEWSQIVEKAKPVAPTFALRSFDAMQPLYNCLRPKSDLRPITHEAIQIIAKRKARQKLSAYAEKNSFLTLAQPIVRKDGKEKSNEFFMRPDRLHASLDGDFFVSFPSHDASTLEIFTQSLSCSKIEEGNRVITFKNATLDQRSKVFDRALAETLLLVEAREREWYSYCGQNCPELEEDRLSMASEEQFADWMSYKALNRYLGRIKNLRERREAAVLFTVDLCEVPGPRNEAPDLAASERQYSFESHSDTRVRRISVFNKENAELNQCRVNEKEQGFGFCEFK